MLMAAMLIPAHASSGSEAYCADLLCVTHNNDHVYGIELTAHPQHLQPHHWTALQLSMLKGSVAEWHHN